MAKRRAAKSLNLRLERARRNGHLGLARGMVPGGPLLNHTKMGCQGEEIGCV